MNPGAMLGLMRLASPALPIGGYSYSQGLETAIERGWVRDEASLSAWLEDLLATNVGRFEAPIVHALCLAITAGDEVGARRLNERFLASRETAELHAETLQMGRSLMALIDALDDAAAGRIAPARRDGAPRHEGATLPLAWARAARRFGVAAEPALAAYVWAWVENQVMAAIKAIPIGQLAGQRTLERLAPALAEAIRRAPGVAAGQWSNFAPGLALASAWHETQYSRIFRS